MFGFEQDLNKEVGRSEKKATLKKRGTANSSPCVIVNRKVCQSRTRSARVFAAATQESFALPQINCEFSDLILLKEQSSLPSEMS